MRLTKFPSLSAVGTYQFRAPESMPPDSPVGRIKANDADVDENAEIEYSITEGDGYDMFGITTDKDTQEGIITVKKVRILTQYQLLKYHLLKYQSKLYLADLCFPFLVQHVLVLI